MSFGRFLIEKAWFGGLAWWLGEKAGGWGAEERAWFFFFFFLGSVVAEEGLLGGWLRISEKACSCHWFGIAEKRVLLVKHICWLLCLLLISKE